MAPGSARTRWGSYSTLPDLLAVIRGRGGTDRQTDTGPMHIDAASIVSRACAQTSLLRFVVVDYSVVQLTVQFVAQQIRNRLHDVSEFERVAFEFRD